MAKVFPLKVDASHDQLQEMELRPAGPTPSMMDLNENDEPEEKRRHHSAHLHKGALPEILQDIYECPVGLEALADTDFITVETQFEPEDVLMGYDSDYRYQILNHDEERIFFAGKISQWKTRHIFWRCNSYEIHAMNSEGSGIFSISCQASCCKDVISVYLEDGLLGTLICGCKLFPSIDIKDDDGIIILRAVMVSCPCCSCYSGPATFDIRVCGTHNNIGKIEKLGRGSHHNDTERYSINFRKDINVRVKVMLVAALFHLGARFLNTRYATLDWRIHADKQQETDETAVLNALADDDSSSEDSKNKQKAMRELGIQKARKLSEEEKLKLLEIEKAKEINDQLLNTKEEQNEDHPIELPNLDVDKLEPEKDKHKTQKPHKNKKQKPMKHLKPEKKIEKEIKYNTTIQGTDKDTG